MVGPTSTMLVVTASNWFFSGGGLMTTKKTYILDNPFIFEHRLLRIVKKSKCSNQISTGGKRIGHSSMEALLTDPEDFQVGRFVGSYGFMNVTR